MEFYGPMIHSISFHYIEEYSEALKEQCDLYFNEPNDIHTTFESLNNMEYYINQMKRILFDMTCHLAEV